MEAIYDACIKFDHDIQAIHDTEISMGADIALFKHLPMLMLKKQRIDKASAKVEYVSIMEEISNTFTALEMVLRCSADSISTCFARIGSELFPILLEFIQNLKSELLEASKLQLISSPNSSKVQLEVTGDVQVRDLPNQSNQQENDRSTSSSTPTQSIDGSIKRLDPESSSPTEGDEEASNWIIASRVTIKTCTKIIGHFAR